MRTLIGIVACVALLAPVSASALTIGKWDHQMVETDDGSLQMDRERTRLREAWKAVWKHNQVVGMKQKMVNWNHRKQIMRHKDMQRGMLALQARANETVDAGINPVPEPSAALVFAAGAMIASARLRRRRNA